MSVSAVAACVIALVSQSISSGCGAQCCLTLACSTALVLIAASHSCNCGDVENARRSNATIVEIGRDR